MKMNLNYNFLQSLISNFRIKFLYRKLFLRDKKYNNAKLKKIKLLNYLLKIFNIWIKNDNKYFSRKVVFARIF